LKTIKLKLDSENLFILDRFFKQHYKNDYRYGTMGFFYWKLVLNKTMKGFFNTISINSELVATTSITPKTLLINGKSINIAELGDTYIKAKYRGRGFFSRLINDARVHAQNQDLKLIYGTPNSQALPMYLKTCNFGISSQIIPFSFRYQLDVNNYLRPKTGSLISNLVNIVYKSLIKLHHIFLNTYNYFLKDYSIESVSNFPIEFDNFWSKASKEWDFVISRNLKNLEYRFSLNPNRYYFLIVKYKNEIIGYMVYKIIYDNLDSRIVIADFLFLNEHKKALNKCLNQIRKICNSNKISYVALWLDLSSIYIPMLRLNGFLYKKNIPFITYLNDFSKSIISLSRIHLTISDTDNI
tara:strand:- start:4731 stop:5792 length:1062 start_codon:yes stop_codon:yes gene_type:complete